MEPSELVRNAREAAGMSQRELARRAGTSQAAVARYEAGRTSPAVKTLQRLLHACGRGLTLSTVELPRTDLSGRLGRHLRDHRAEVAALARSRGARNIRVFGSVARGEDGPDSDIDLLVDLDESRTLLDLAGLGAELRDLLGVPVDVATMDLLKDRVREEVIRENVPL